MKLSATKYAQLLLSLAEDERISEEMVAAFLTLLRKHRQEKLLPRILQVADRLYKKTQGIQDVSLTVPEKIDTKELEATLQKSLDAKEVSVHEIVDPNCLGGARLQIDDVAYDLTLRRQLENLKTVLLS